MPKLYEENIPKGNHLCVFCFENGIYMLGYYNTDLKMFYSYLSNNILDQDKIVSWEYVMEQLELGGNWKAVVL
jgi:hypothetical protein